MMIVLDAEALELVALFAFTAQMTLFATVVTALFVTLRAIASYMSRTTAVAAKSRVVPVIVSTLQAVSGKMPDLVAVVTSGTTTAGSVSSGSAFYTFVRAIPSQMSGLTAVVTRRFAK